MPTRTERYNFKPQAFEVKAPLDLDDRLNPQGIFYQHTDNPGVTASFTDDEDELRKRMQSIAKASTIIERMFTINRELTDQRVNYVFTTVDGGKLSVMDPTSKYGKRVALLNAIPANFETTPLEYHENGDVKPHRWSDLGDSTRRTFSDTSVALVQEMHNTSAPHEKAMFMQNFANVLAPTTSQSQFHIHGHAVLADHSKITPLTFDDEMAAHEAQRMGVDIHTYKEMYGEEYTLKEILDVPTKDILRMRREKMILQDPDVMEMGEALMRRGIERYLQRNDLSIGYYSIGVRETEPYGITIAFNGKEDAITAANATDPENLARIFTLREALAEVYPRVAHIIEARAFGANSLGQRYGQEFSNDLSYPKQPSSQQILDFDENGVFRTHQIAMMSRKGPVEKTGGLLVREYNTSLIDPNDTTARSDSDRYAEVARLQVERTGLVINTESYEDAA